jgi:hypothetical protein
MCLGDQWRRAPKNDHKIFARTLDKLVRASVIEGRKICNGSPPKAGIVEKCEYFVNNLFLGIFVCFSLPPHLLQGKLGAHLKSWRYATGFMPHISAANIIIIKMQYSLSGLFNSCLHFKYKKINEKFYLKHLNFTTMLVVSNIFFVNSVLNVFKGNFFKSLSMLFQVFTAL